MSDMFVKWEGGEGTYLAFRNDSLINSNELRIFFDAMNELESARKRYPTWPQDIVHATATMLEEAGETLQAANNVYWSHKGGTMEDVRKEAIHTMAMCLRLLTETPGL